MRRLYLNSVSFFILIGAFAASFAATPPPAMSSALLAHQATLRSAPANEMTMGRLQVRFEKTSLDDVLGATSAGVIAHQGDAGESIYWLCYTSLNSTFAERIWIISDGEMGGDRHFVTEVSAQRLPKGGASVDCPALPASLKPLALERGIWLDTPPRVVRQKLGTPSFKNAIWQSYEYEGKVPGRCEGDGFDLTNALFLQVEKGRINFLRARHITSC